MNIFFEKLGEELDCRMTPNNEETKKKIGDTSKRIEVSSISSSYSLD